jgi:hypothetical protein
MNFLKSRESLSTSSKGSGVKDSFSIIRSRKRLEAVMRQAAHLITPDGKAIELPTEVYKQVKRLLDSHRRHRNRSRGQEKAAIQAGYGLLAGKDSLTKALLVERNAERNREEIKIARFGK